MVFRFEIPITNHSAMVTAVSVLVGGKKKRDLFRAKDVNGTQYTLHLGLKPQGQFLFTKIEEQLVINVCMKRMARLHNFATYLRTKSFHLQPRVKFSKWDIQRGVPRGSLAMQPTLMHPNKGKGESYARDKPTAGTACSATLPKTLL